MHSEMQRAACDRPQLPRDKAVSEVVSNRHHQSLKVS